MALRITGGILRSRQVRVPGRMVRPTQDRVRAAIFSSLAAWIPDARILDLFAGTGVLGLEAYSRGAAFVGWVESDRRVYTALRENVRILCGDAHAGVPGQPEARALESSRVRIWHADVWRFLQRAWTEPPCNLIFADPPYAAAEDALKKLLSVLAPATILASGGILVMEQSARAPSPSWAGWTLRKSSRYGETQILMLQKP